MAVKAKTIPATLIKIIALQEYLNKTGFKEQIKGTHLFDKIYKYCNGEPLNQETIVEIITEHGIEEILSEIRDEEQRILGEKGHCISVDYIIYLAGLYYGININRSEEQYKTPSDMPDEPEENSPEIQDCESWRPPQKKIS